MKKRPLSKILSIIVLVLFLPFNTEAAVIGLGICGRLRKPVKSMKEIKTANIVSQSVDYSCGPASLATLLSYYFEDKVTEEEIIEFLLLSGDLEKIKAKKGFSLLDLKNFARHKGYEVVGYKMDLDFLVKLNKPVLIPVNIKDYSHFIIFRGLKANRVFLADPALGNLTMKTERFIKMWQGGIGLALSKEGEEKSSSALKLSADEEAVVAGSSAVRPLLGINSLGKVFGQGEF